MEHPHTILELSAEEARKFFLRNESFCNIDLPLYFDFQPLLDCCNDIVSRNSWYEIQYNHGLRKDDQDEAKHVKNIDNVNYKFYQNKDGQYSWRPLQIINPLVYVFLVQEITKEDNWNIILDRFSEFSQVENIFQYSLPLIPAVEGEDKSESVTNWWKKIEKKSIELALEYTCFANTDISDCYGSLYTHSIPWALHRKDRIKVNREKKKSEQIDFLGDRIDRIIQSMSYGQTNGIPQGSLLMDFIAEMVLGYEDLLLDQKIKEYNSQQISRTIGSHVILRYRDDYRIFAKSQEEVAIILKLLSEVLSDNNLKLNVQKTFISNDVIRDAIKPDKSYWNTHKQGEGTLLNHLLIIYDLSQKYPNSGSLQKALSKFHKRIYPLTIIKEENSKGLISILVDIAYKNPRTYPNVMSIISKILVQETNVEKIKDIVGLISLNYSY